MYKYTLEVVVDPKQPVLLRDVKYPNPVSKGDRICIKLWPDQKENFEVLSVTHEEGSKRSIIALDGEGTDWKKFSESGFMFTIGEQGIPLKQPD